MKNLTGTEKQIKWGNDIRNSLIEKLDLQLLNIEGLEGRSLSRATRTNNRVNETINKINEIEESTFFINNRSLLNNTREFFEEVAKSVGTLQVEEKQGSTTLSWTV